MPIASPSAALIDPTFPFPEVPWIWVQEHDESEVNASFIFERELSLPEGCKAGVVITADSRYWLRINGGHAASGPARGFRDLLFFDTVDVSNLLRPGINRIEITVTHWGIDTFQYQRGAPGLRVAFYDAETGRLLLASDKGWRVRRAVELEQRVPRISIQQGFEEHFDARAAANVPGGAWRAATVLDEKLTSGRRLQKRATGNLGRVPRPFKRVVLAEHVRKRSDAVAGWSLPVRRHFSPFPKSANQHGMAGVIACIFSNEKLTRLRLFMIGPEVRVWIDGVELGFRSDQDLRVGTCELAPGDHWVGMALCTEYDHATELAWTWEGEGEWRCPLPGGKGGVWIGTGPLWTRAEDTNCFMHKDGPGAFAEDTPYVPPYGCMFSPEKKFLWEKVAAIASSRALPGFLAAAGSGVRILEFDDFSAADAYLALRTDQVHEAPNSVVAGQLPGPLEIAATPSRIVLDLGGMSVGCFEMVLDCPAGTVVDGFFFEHLEELDEASNGIRIQYLHQAGGLVYRNSFRYTACEGRNVFLSRQRRGGRYVILVFRSGPVRLHRVGLVEETYAPGTVATFDCSDERLNRIFAIASRTLLLCMEDTLTDCPTYEQAFWVGDARNEALYACKAFGAYDLARHCARLAARSLDDLPLVASQCPSGWDVIIPSFSFLWTMSVWDFFWETGDQAFLRELYPAIKSNLGTAARYCTDHGLFRAPAWNFLDWTPIDQDRQTVLHNSMLFAAALEVGMKTAQVMGHTAEAAEFSTRRTELVAAMQRLWDPARGAWRDALLDDGTPSEAISQHTSFLALLNGLASHSQRPDAVRNCLAPPTGMTRVGSPNAMFYLLEALRKEGRVEETLTLLRDFWGRMLDAGADTFWEMINPPGSEFPTRSRCQGWSSSPVYLLPRLLFGIECVEPGWRRVVLRPAACGLSFARAQICTPHGLLDIGWHKASDGTLDVRVNAPEGVSVSVHPSLVLS